mgnify:CR=1 FL=1
MATNLRSAGNRSRRPDREAKSDAKQQEKIRQREKDRQERKKQQQAKDTFKTNLTLKSTDTISKATIKQQQEIQKKQNELAAKALAHQQQLERTRKEEAKRLADAQAYSNSMLAATRARREQYMQGGLDSVAYIPDSLRMIRTAKRGGLVGYTQRWKNARRKNSKT